MTTVLAPVVNRESHTVSQSLFQRRARLASLDVEFGKSTSAFIAPCRGGRGAGGVGSSLA